MLIELDFELSFPHPLTNQEKPFFFFAVIRNDGEGDWGIEKIDISEGASKPVINDLLEFCNPDLLLEMDLEAEKYIKKQIDNDLLW